MSSNPAISEKLKEVADKITNITNRTQRIRQPRLVAVSKTKPVELIKAAYEAGLRTFGENYVQEMIEKAPLLPSDIQWHFIGHLQSNKIKKLLEAVPNLEMIETIDSEKLASKLDTTLENSGKKLKILVQVNTSGEETKYGVKPREAIDLADYIHKNCPNLIFSGFMTIGMPDYTSTPENFKCLLSVRSEASEKLNINIEDIEVSMGMSGDYELAIELGSTSVRVGSAIFGARQYT